MAILVITMFLIGQFRLTTLISAETKVIPLTIHILLGVTLMIVVLLRLAIRRRVVSKPFFSRNLSSTRKNPTDQINRITQPLLYITTLLMGISGLSMSIPADLFGKLILGNGQPLPADMSIFPARQFHVFFSILLIFFVMVHLLVFVQHQFLFKEKYIEKMWFSKRKLK